MIPTLKAARVQKRVIGALIYREIITKVGHNRAGILSVLGSSVSQILIFSIIFTAIGRNNPIGGSIVLFIATAVIPYNMCIQMAKEIMNYSQNSKALLTHPVITPFDTIIAKVLVESIIHLTAATLIFVCVGFLGFWDYSYDSLLGIELVIIISILLGFGLGLINSALASKFKFYPKVWSLLTRPLFFMSGIFYVASERFPPEVMAILYFNPILHITEWSRSSFYQSWDSNFVDFYYLGGFVLTIIFIGMALQLLMQEDTRE